MGMTGRRKRVAVTGPTDFAEDLRLGALNVLGDTPATAIDAAVCRCMDDPSPELRMAALRAAQRRGMQSLHAMLPVIETRLDDSDPGVRLAAAEAIAVLPEASDLLVGRLKDHDPNLRACAVTAVAPEVPTAAISALDDSSAYVRQAAAQVLASSGALALPDIAHRLLSRGHAETVKALCRTTPDAAAAIGEMIVTHADDRTTFLSAVEVLKATNPTR